MYLITIQQNKFKPFPSWSFYVQTLSQSRQVLYVQSLDSYKIHGKKFHIWFICKLYTTFKYPKVSSMYFALNPICLPTVLFSYCTDNDMFDNKLLHHQWSNTGCACTENVDNGWLDLTVKTESRDTFCCLVYECWVIDGA